MRKNNRYSLNMAKKEKVSVIKSEIFGHFFAPMGKVYCFLIGFVNFLIAFFIIFYDFFL